MSLNPTSFVDGFHDLWREVQSNPNSFVDGFHGLRNWHICYSMKLVLWFKLYFYLSIIQYVNEVSTFI